MITIIIIICVAASAPRQAFDLQISYGKGPRPERRLRGWRNTVEQVLFEISNSKKTAPLCVSRIYQ